MSEKPKFSVTRHTPRQPARTRPHIRVDLSPADEQMGKRIKLDSEDQASKVASAVPKKKGAYMKYTLSHTRMHLSKSVGEFLLFHVVVYRCCLHCIVFHFQNQPIMRSLLLSVLYGLV